ncbi:MAG: selenobiotic family peptide radical SAM maturase [Deltaproteobacteria bacterium]
MDQIMIDLENSFAGCRSLIDPDAWRGIVFGWDRLETSQAFLDSVQNYARSTQAPLFLAELARLEWHIWKVKNQEIEMPASALQIALNPSLVLLDLAWVDLTTFPDTLNPAAPHPGQELVLIWKHPQTREVNVESALSESLLVLKMVIENIDAGDIAKIGAIPLAAVRSAIDRAAEKGIIFLPSSRIRRNRKVEEASPYTDEQFQVSSSFTLQLHITQACDLHCRHCYDRSDRQALTLPEALRILDEMDHFCREHNVSGQVSFTGGNPLLHPDFPAMYQAAADYGFTLNVLGNPCDEKQITRLQDIQPLNFFQVSLEGLPEHNDYIRGKGHFERTMRFLALLRRMNVYSMVMLTLTKDNMDQVIALGEFLQGKTNAFFFNRLTPVGEGAALALPSRESYISFLYQYLEAAKRLPVLGYKDNLLNIAMQQQGMAPFGGCTGFGCGAAFNFLSVLPDGEVHACRKFPSLIGNLKTQTIAEVYDSEAPLRYRNGSEACRSCRMHPVCGGCLASTYSHGLDIFTHKDPFCFYRP